MENLGSKISPGTFTAASSALATIACESKGARRSAAEAACRINWRYKSWILWYFAHRHLLYARLNIVRYTCYRTMFVNLTGTAKRRMASKDNWAEFVGVPSVSPGEVTRWEEAVERDVMNKFYLKLSTGYTRIYMEIMKDQQSLRWKKVKICSSPWSSNAYLMSMGRIHRLPVRRAQRLENILRFNVHKVSIPLCDIILFEH